MGRTARLYAISENNNNKFYFMDENPDGQTFHAKWGRIGNEKVNEMDYPMSDWDKVYKKRTCKPAGQESYVDKTNLAEVTSSDDKGMDIKDREVLRLIEYLMAAAKKTISDSYVSSIKEVTQKQIDAAQEILDTLATILSTGKFTTDQANKMFLDLYKTIPRKMSNTKKFILQSPDTKFFGELLQNEQNLLNTLSSQVTVASSKSSKITLEGMGFDVVIASQEDRDRIAKETDFKVSNQKIFKVVNNKSEKDYDKSIGGTKLLYHGSRNENWLSILMNGLKIRPNGVHLSGSMFGNGIYGANKAAKSIGYTSLEGSYWGSGAEKKAYLAIFEFALGKQWNVFANGKRWDYDMQRLDLKKVNSNGYNSVFAKGGADLRNDEFIVYQPSQCTIRYLIEITK